MLGSSVLGLVKPAELLGLLIKCIEDLGNAMEGFAIDGQRIAEAMERCTEVYTRTRLQERYGMFLTTLMDEFRATRVCSDSCALTRSRRKAVDTKRGRLL